MKDYLPESKLARFEIWKAYVQDKRNHVIDRSEARHGR
jgi:hypothetical protein